jgi:hypothetical protein
MNNPALTEAIKQYGELSTAYINRSTGSYCGVSHDSIKFLKALITELKKQENNNET